MISASGAAGSSDTKGKAAKGSGERSGSRASFKSVVSAVIRVHSCSFVVKDSQGAAKPSSIGVSNTADLHNSRAEVNGRSQPDKACMRGRTFESSLSCIPHQ